MVVRRFARRHEFLIVVEAPTWGQADGLESAEFLEEHIGDVLATVGKRAEASNLYGKGLQD